MRQVALRICCRDVVKQIVPQRFTRCEFCGVERPVISRAKHDSAGDVIARHKRAAMAPQVLKQVVMAVL